MTMHICAYTHIFIYANESIRYCSCVYDIMTDHFILDNKLGASSLEYTNSSSLSIP